LRKEISCVLLAEPHHGLAEGTRALLATRFDAVVMVADEVSLLETAARLKPALLLVDVALARRNVAGLIARLKENSPGSKVMVLSVQNEPTVARAVYESGGGRVSRQRPHRVPALMRYRSHLSRRALRALKI
jgi:DNA-binding NarL/FixJ family response regulator